MDPSRPGHLRSDRAGLHGRGNDPLLLRSRPTSASLHRRDHFNLRLRHRSSPRITPMTCHNDSAPQGGPYRVLTVLQTSMLLVYSRQIALSALEHRLPTVYGYREHVVAGGLISYGVDLRWCYYRGAYFVDKILRGT